MQLKCGGSQPSMKGPAEWFTGTVRIDPLHNPPALARVSCAAVTFEPGTRTAWDTHALGRMLIVIAGCGWMQFEASPSARSVRAMPSRARRAIGTGMAVRPLRP
jgi:quercetin dioxygenase-like cupin family protein